MEYNTSTRFERETSALIALFESGEFKEAKIAADQLVQKGYLRPLVCKTLYNPFIKLIISNPETAETAANAFRAYDFQYWLPENQRQ